MSILPMNGMASIPAKPFPFLAAFKEQARLALPVDTSNSPQRLYHYMGPTQVASLFMAGVGTSFAMKWFGRALSIPTVKISASAAKPMESLTKNAKDVQDQTWVLFTEGLSSVLNFAMQNPGDVQKRLMGYLGASVLGYVTGSIADGAQEVMVRKEETQIRADLIKRLTDNFRQSIQLKTGLDNHLREQAKRRVASLLTQCKIPYPEELLKPVPDLPVDKLYRYPYEPVHFSFPVTPASQYRFGASVPELSKIEPPDSTYLNGMKGAVYGFGILCGGLGQFMIGLMRHATSIPGVNQLPKETGKIFTRIFNVSNLEALFLTGNGQLLMTVLGLTAAAKIGKMLIDGYREIEVTRQNAHTELRYQAYNWLALDPSFHRIAEEEALEDSLKKLREAIPFEYNNRKALGRRIQTMLANIGRNSAPKYFQMTPSVNLVAARS